MIKVNIGGTVFTTSKTTLCSRSTFFSTLLAKENADRDEQGNLFVDRDPKHFAFILNYLRDSKCFLGNNDESELIEILNEATFYCLVDLKHGIEKKLHKIQQDANIAKQNSTLNQSNVLILTAKLSMVFVNSQVAYTPTFSCSDAIKKEFKKLANYKTLYDFLSAPFLEHQYNFTIADHAHLIFENKFS